MQKLSCLFLSNFLFLLLASLLLATRTESAPLDAPPDGPQKASLATPEEVRAAIAQLSEDDTPGEPTPVAQASFFHKKRRITLTETVYPDHVMPTPSEDAWSKKVTEKFVESDTIPTTSLTLRSDDDLITKATDRPRVLLRTTGRKATPLLQPTIASPQDGEVILRTSPAIGSDQKASPTEPLSQPTPASSEEKKSSKYEPSPLYPSDAVETPHPVGPRAHTPAVPVPDRYLPEEYFQNSFFDKSVLAPYPVYSCGDCGQTGCGGCSNCPPLFKPNSRTERFLLGLYKSLICPDDCYDPKWRPLEAAAFWTQSPRPVSQHRLRWDASFARSFPDRAGYFWSKIGSSGPSLNSAFTGGDYRLDAHVLSSYTEVASKGNTFAATTEMTYRSMTADFTDPGHYAGLAAMRVGTKTMLFDCEWLQIAMATGNDIPVGQQSDGLRGETGMDFSLLLGVNISRRMYLQAQFTEWFTFVSLDDVTGSIFHFHLALNRSYRRILVNVPIITVLEFNGWFFQSGGYTNLAGSDPTQIQRASSSCYLSVAPGIRLAIGDKLDFGASIDFGLTQDSWAKYTLATELRWRY